MLREYLTREKDDQPLRGLAEIARQVTKKDDVLVSVDKANPTACVLCHKEGAVVTCVMAKGHTDVVLLCADCLPSDHVKTATAIKRRALAMDTVFVWRCGKQLRILTDGLHTEELDDDPEG